MRSLPASPAAATTPMCFQRPATRAFGAGRRLPTRVLDEIWFLAGGARRTRAGTKAAETRWGLGAPVLTNGASRSAAWCRNWPVLLKPYRVVLVLDSSNFWASSGFRVDDDLAAARQVHDHVGPEKTVLGRRRALLFEVTVLGHAGRLDCVAQRHFAPATARLRGPKCRDQVPRLLLQLLMSEVQCRHAFAQSGVGALALDLHVTNYARTEANGLPQAGSSSWAIACSRRCVEVALTLAVRTSLSLESASKELLVVLRQCPGRQLEEGSGQPAPCSSSARRASLRIQARAAAG